MRDLSECQVLVVDDTATNLDILVDTLGNDYEVSVAIDGESALESAMDQTPDLVLLDIMMPGIDGYEVCRRLKRNERTRHVPIIFLTAMAEVTDEAKGLALGAVDYITKPFTPDLVKARVHNQLQLKRFRDDLERQNQILIENARLREDVAHMTRHDLKTPLNAMINIPEMLVKYGNLTPDQSEMLQMIEESGYRMLEIIESSLDLCKMERGEYQLRPVPVNILKMAYQIRGETRNLIHSKGLALEVAVEGRTPAPSDLFEVQGEEMLVYSMLANLIKNAAEASPDSGRIKVNCQKGIAGFSEVRIHNSGVIPAEIQDRFFEKYATLGKEGGTGLGTYSARLIATAMGGGIRFETSEEKGTELIVWLPVDHREIDENTVDPSGKAPSAVFGEEMTALIADDYLPMRFILQSTLYQMGIQQIRSVKDGSEAKKIVDTQKVDLIISDLNMPKMTGMQLLHYVRSNTDRDHIPFILVTAEADKRTVANALQSGVTDYIVKPFSADILRKKIETLF